jgi:hypothetical protein
MASAQNQAGNGAMFELTKKEIQILIDALLTELGEWHSTQSNQPVKDLLEKLESQLDA